MIALPLAVEVQAPLIAAPPPAPVMMAPPAPILSAAPAGAVSPHRIKTPGDPHESFNRHMFRVQNRLDHAVLRPVAMGYKHIVPRFLRSAIRNFFGNLGEPTVFVNFMLQHKIGRATKTVVRFAINSTIGLGGTIDVARSKAVELPHQPNGFGDTLGFYGVKPGPYLFLPLVGPSTVRDLFAGQADGLMLLAFGTPFNSPHYQVPRAVLTGLDQRAERDGDLRVLMDSAIDPYATLRSVYLQDRAGEIAALKGAPDPNAGFDQPLNDPAAVPAKPAGAAPELEDPLADPAAPTPTAAGTKSAPPKPASAAPELTDPLADPAVADPKAPARR